MARSIPTAENTETDTPPAADAEGEDTLRCWRCEEAAPVAEWTYLSRPMGVSKVICPNSECRQTQAEAAAKDRTAQTESDQ